MAKIFWCSNVPFPAQATRFGLQESQAGFWMLSLADAIQSSSDTQLVIACCSPCFRSYDNFEHDGVIYECIPDTKDRLKFLSDILKGYNPDVIHIHGTEQDYGLVEGVDRSKLIVSIQGLLGPYSKAYWGALSYWKRFRFPSLLKGHAGMKSRARAEDAVFQKNINFGGRTIWDKAHVAEFNPKSNYYYLPEFMRPCFFSKQWKLEDSQPYRIYTTSTPRPYKGTDILIEAVALLKRKYPGISLRIGGPFGDRPLSWSRALRRKVRKLGLENNVEFIGFLNETEILRELLETRVYVLPSFIENSPNSLAEAQITGVPCVTTAMGGVLSMVEHERSGLLTNVGDPAVMAESIDRILSDSELASKIGEGAMRVARLRHDPKHAVECYLDTYSKMSANEIS